MYIYQTVNVNDFIEAFKAFRRDDFSLEGLRMIFSDLERCAEETGSPVELDVISFCCSYTESSLKDINQDYSQEFETLEEAEEWLQENTYVVGATAKSIVYGAF